MRAASHLAVSLFSLSLRSRLARLAHGVLAPRSYPGICSWAGVRAAVNWVVSLGSLQLELKVAGKVWLSNRSPVTKWIFLLLFLAIVTGYGEGCGGAGVTWPGTLPAPMGRTLVHLAGAGFFTSFVFPLHGGLAVPGVLQAFLTVAPHHRCWHWVLDAGHGTGCCCPAIGHRVCPVGPFPPPPGLLYFHSRPWEDGAQPCLLCWLFKKEFIYEHLVAAPVPADLGIITLVTRWQQNTDYFWGQYWLVLFSVSYIIIGWMKVCGAINLLFPSRITSRPSWQTGMLMTDWRDFYFTLAFSLINNLMAFFFFCLL